MTTTVTASTVTISATTTLTVTSTELTSFATAPTTVLVGRKRDVSSEAVAPAKVAPSYASYCSGTVRYSSACSCWGFTASATTLPALTKTINQTVTETTTTTTTSLYAATATSTNPACLGNRFSPPFDNAKWIHYASKPIYEPKEVVWDGQPAMQLGGDSNDDNYTSWPSTIRQDVVLCPGAVYDFSLDYFLVYGQSCVMYLYNERRSTTSSLFTDTSTAGQRLHTSITLPPDWFGLTMLEIRLACFDGRYEMVYMNNFELARRD
ncbi:hypothetical protein K402DRAFT_460863 [Aulographum hederae CBS 113979]|uniref:Uncharacterized protein n=1 Tax=Aulographum hederae CBS 113979 TaxID=1176131 RepID=A0A6G1HAB7_9PEZI|nr:hypothetical protein K402DRAFT_460863 [Aulographum hederae CBS 113979]